MDGKIQVPAWATKPMRPFMEIARRRQKLWSWVAFPLVMLGLAYWFAVREFWLLVIGVSALTRATHWTGVRTGSHRRERGEE